MAPVPIASDVSNDATDHDLELLTGGDAGGMLDAALAAAGGTLQRWRAHDVTHHPGRGTTVSYEAKVRWADGRSSTETMAACTGKLPDGALHLDDGAVRGRGLEVPARPRPARVGGGQRSTRRGPSARRPRIRSRSGPGENARLPTGSAGRDRGHRPRRTLVHQGRAARSCRGLASPPPPPRRRRRSGTAEPRLDRRRPARPPGAPRTDAARSDAEPVERATVR